MELPPALRTAIDRARSGRSAADLAKAAAALSQRYRDERRDGRFHVYTDEDTLAYLTVRLPHTYAPVRASFAAIAQARPDFAPTTALGVGSVQARHCGRQPIAGPRSPMRSCSRQARRFGPAAKR